MARTALPFDEGLRDHVFRLLEDVCWRRRIYPCGLLAGRRSPGVSRARAELICRLRETVGTRRVVESRVIGGDGKTRMRVRTEVMVLAEGGRMPAGWKPISFPNIGMLLGLDHTGALYLWKRWVKDWRLRPMAEGG